MPRHRRPTSSNRRFALPLVLLALPALATAVLAAAYLRGALRHHEAVLNAADQVAGVILRDVFDLLASEIAAASRPWVDAALLTEGSREARLERMRAVADSLRDCGSCVRLDLAGFGVVGPAADVGVPPGSADWDWGRVESTGPQRMFSALTGTDDEPRLTLVRGGRMPGERPSFIAWMEVDLDRFGPTVLEPTLERVLPTYLAGLEPPWLDQVGLRVVHPSGGVVYDRGPDPSSTPVQYTLEFFTEELATAQVVRSSGMRFTLALDEAAIAAFLPGGLPASPWPLALVATLGALGVTVLGAVLLMKLRAVTALREQFVSSVSHELRTPLAKIMSFGETLQLERPTPQARARAAETIVREARKLTHLVENTLDFARLGRAEPTLSPERLDLAELVPRTVRETLEMVADPPDVEICIADAPAVWADRAATGRIVRNLLENALRHTPTGTRIRISAQATSTGARILVEDGGPGIPPGERAAVWTPFHHVARQPGGTGSGLGLAIVRQLVELQGGTAVIGESPLGGARFTITLPDGDAPRADR